MLLVCTRMHSYVTRMYSYVTRMLLVCTRMLLVCTRRSPVWCSSHDRIATAVTCIPIRYLLDQFKTCAYQLIPLTSGCKQEKSFLRSRFKTRHLYVESFFSLFFFITAHTMEQDDYFSP